jgi:hypothetical protein
MHEKISDIDSQVIRRKDLVELGDDFKRALSPITVVISHLERTNKDVRLTRLLVLLVAALAAVVLVVLFLVVRQVAGVVQQVEGLHSRGVVAVEELEKLTVAVTQAKASTERVEEASKSQSTLQLVAETDPVRARKAPVKLVIQPPAASTSSPPEKKPVMSTGFGSAPRSASMKEVPESPVPPMPPLEIPITDLGPR